MVNKLGNFITKIILKLLGVGIFKLYYCSSGSNHLLLTFPHLRKQRLIYWRSEVNKGKRKTTGQKEKENMQQELESLLEQLLASFLSSHHSFQALSVLKSSPDLQKYLWLHWHKTAVGKKWIRLYTVIESKTRYSGLHMWTDPWTQPWPLEQTDQKDSYEHQEHHHLFFDNLILCNEQFWVL